MSETATLLALVVAVTLVDLLVFRLGFPMPQKGWRLLRFVVWYHLVAASLGLLYVLFAIVFLRDVEHVFPERIWHVVVVYHPWFSLAYAIYLEWFSGRLTRKGKSVEQ